MLFVLFLCNKVVAAIAPLLLHLHPRLLAKHLPARIHWANRKLWVKLALCCFVPFLLRGIVAGLVRWTGQAQSQHETVVGYSVKMAESIITRQQGVVVSQPVTAALPLQAGITQRALTAVLERYSNNSRIRTYLDYSASSIAPVLTDAAENVESWPLDRLANGIAMIQNGSSQYDGSLAGLRGSIGLNPRTGQGGLWYWLSYPQWAYLDGMYALAPFWTLDALALEAANVTTTSNTTRSLDDMHLQLSLLWEHCRNTSTGLLVHGYDASRTAPWADRATGASGIVWGRSLGWYAMALVDVAELLGARDTGAVWLPGVLDKYGGVARALMLADDPATGAWFQVVDQPARSGNYIESSATAMFSYALLKGARLGLLAAADAAAAQSAGERAYRYMTAKFVQDEGNGTLGWSGTVAVCSLNSTANYEYYVSQPIEYNSVLGAAAFVLAAVEYEHVQAMNQPAGPPRPL